MHPHHEHKAHKKEKARVAHITKGYASGGAVHDDETADKKLIKRTVKKTALKMDGHKPKHRADRRARGGKVKSKKGTTVNIINSPGHAMGGAPGMMPGAGLPPGMPPHPPVALPPPGAPPPMGGMPPGAMAPHPMPPGMSPAMPPGAMPPRKAGGRAGYAKGGAVKDGPAWKEGLRNGTQVQHDDGKMDQKNINRGKPITYAKGGAVGDAGDLSSPRHGARKPHPESVTKTGARLVQFYAGGKVESPEGVDPATKLPGGSGGGEARLAKEHRAEKRHMRAK